MSSFVPLKPDPKLDLTLERVIDVPVELVWAAWTKPEHLVKWFAPAPWTVTSCDIELRPGGTFRTTMRSPEGNEFPHVGTYLDIVPTERLVWTDALLPGFRPSTMPFVTVVLTLTREGNGTRYSAVVLHKDEAERKRHEEMGFHAGWSTALDQLIAHTKTM